MEVQAGADPGRSRRDLVVIGASAGGVETLQRVVADLPPDLPAAICIVLHIAPTSPSVLAQILARAGSLPCRPASDCDELRPGEILVAPPDRHLVVEDGRVRLTLGPRENNHRPAVDALFRSAALERGTDVIGVILSGTRDDGTAGLAMIKACGGMAIVQDPRDALYEGMPRAALDQVGVDAVVPSGQIAAAIEAMVNEKDRASNSDPSPRGPQAEASGALTMICPECGGVLSEHREAGVSQWECRVGHRYSPETLADAQAEDVEAALWTAVRALADRSRLLHRMADRAELRDQPRTARSFRKRAHEADQQAAFVRRALTQAAQGPGRKLGDEEGERTEAEDGVA